MKQTGTTKGVKLKVKQINEKQKRRRNKTFLKTQSSLDFQLVFLDIAHQIVSQEFNILYMDKNHWKWVIIKPESSQ